MNILHIYKDYFPARGGIENHIRMLAEAQSDVGHEVTALVCADGFRGRSAMENGVRVIRSGRLITAASMPISLSMPLMILRQSPDIVHLHSPFPLGEASNLLFGRGKKTVITYHSDIVRQKNLLRVYGPILKKVLKRADRIIVGSPNYIETSPWLSLTREKCSVVPFGVDLEKFSPDPLHDGSRSDNLRPIVLFAGKHRYYKNLDTLLEALKILPEAEAAILGDGPMRETWEARSREMGLADRVRFYGEVDDASLANWYRKADVFVLPSNSRAEAFGLVLEEAMASGLPCIATELGTGTSFVVKDGETGFVVPPENPEALAEALKKLFQDAGLRQRMGKAGRKRAEEFFSQNAMVSGVMAVYEKALV